MYFIHPEKRTKLPFKTVKDTQQYSNSHYVELLFIAL